MQIVEININELKPYEKNPRKNDEAVKYVAESIKQFGFKVPCVIDRNNVIVAGHTRYKAAKQLKLKTVPCIIADDLTDEQIKAFRLADNKVAEKAEWDFDLLEFELDDILDIDMSDFGFDDYEYDITNEDREQEFRERMASGELSEDSEEYQEFLRKFEAKKTTDDCYTPQNIYDCVKEWAVNRFLLDGCPIVRPFYPGGDYQNEKYPRNCVVIDNPPFSIISDICAWYDKKGIRFFLFAPTLTLLGIARGGMNYIGCGATVTYENGANVNTSFVTNMGNKKIVTSSELRELIDKCNAENLKAMHKELPRYSYPPYVLTGTMLSYFSNHHTDFECNVEDCYFIRELDAQKDLNKSLYGSGFLLSEKVAAEKAAAIVWELSEREREIISSLGK